MSAQHTPGPWLVREDGESNFFGVMCNGNWLLRIQHNGEQTVEKQKANIQLVVTAPELLAALQEILPFIPKTSAAEGGASTHSANVRAADSVRAAIAKATGAAS